MQTGFWYDVNTTSDKPSEVTNHAAFLVVLSNSTHTRVGQFIVDLDDLTLYLRYKNNSGFGNWKKSVFVDL